MTGKETLEKAREAVKRGPDYVKENAEDIVLVLMNMHVQIDKLQKKLDEEERYHKWVQDNKIKGYCCGYVTRYDISQSIAHDTYEQYEKEKIELRKLINNPALSESVKKTLRRALWMISAGWSYRNKLFQIEGKKGEG